MIIRDATNRDLGSLAKLGYQLSKYEAHCDTHLKIRISTIRQKKLEFTKKLKRKNVKILVVEFDGSLIGYCIGSIEKAPQYFDIKKIGYVNSCFVDDKFRGQSIGKQLISSLILWFKNKRINVIELGVLHANISATVWRKMGFQDYYIKMRKLI